MSETKQVEANHYEFRKYLGLERWSSIWHQIDQVIQFQPESVLEIGPGPGIFKASANQLGLHVETLDIDSNLRPDHVGSATNLQFEAGTFDVVCAFQMLEHLPYEKSLQAFSEFARVCRKKIIISLPDCRKMYRVSIEFPKFGQKTFLIPKPRLKPRPHRFDGEHYWEIGKLEHPLNRVIGDLSKFAKLESTYRVPENPYHRIFVFAVNIR